MSARTRTEVWKLATATYDRPGGRPVPTVLGYRACVPWEVTARFITEPASLAGDRVWLVARDLLEAGLHGPVGEGDVGVSPAGEHVRVWLGTDQGRAVLYLPTRSLRTFLDATARLVPFGTESDRVNLDALCDALRRAA